MIHPTEIKSIDKDTKKFSTDTLRSLRELEAEINRLKQRIQNLEKKVG